MSNIYKILCGGGLGDALMIYGKLGKLDISIKDIELTHVEIPNNLLRVINEYYKSQNINVIVKQIPNWDWKNKHKKKYDLVLDTSAYGIEDDGIEINPFPLFNIVNEYISDIVISPSSGRNNERNFNLKEIKNFIGKHIGNKRIFLIGTEQNKKQFDGMGTINLINIGTIQESIDIVASSKYVIAPSGFVSFLGCMLRKEVYSKDGRKDIENRYYHKSWNNKFVRNLNEINI